MERRIVRIAQFVVLFLIVVAGFGTAVLFLWNWLMPELFGLRPISFSQALGLMGLSWILFRAGFLGRIHHDRPRARWSELTPEERERFRHGLECGRRGAPPAEPNV
jgi:hypothetical protein